MSTFDQAIRIVGTLLLISLGVLSLRIEGKRLKRMMAGAFVLVLFALLADATMHLLPNAISGFIYRTNQHYAHETF